MNQDILQKAFDQVFPVMKFLHQKYIQNKFKININEGNINLINYPTKDIFKKKPSKLKKRENIPKKTNVLLDLFYQGNVK